MSAKLVLRLKRVGPSGLQEYVVWDVPVDERSPDGVRYRLAFVPFGLRRPVVLYDNHHPKGHHKHLNGVEAAYSYRGIAELVADFEEDVSHWRKQS